MQQKAPLPRRGGRVVEGAALEMLYRGNSIEGSNPSLSVIKVDEPDFQIPKTSRPTGGFFMSYKPAMIGSVADQPKRPLT